MTVEKVAWIVGVGLGSMFESEAVWAEKIMGKTRVKRICHARNLVALALYEELNVSYNEIAYTLNRRHESVIARGIQQARKWVAENEAAWKRIKKAIRDTTNAEIQHHSTQNNIKVGLSD